MGSNLSFAIRGIFSKKLMTSPVGENMDPANLFAVLTIMSFTLMLPFVIYWEGGEIEERLEEAYVVYGDEKEFQVRVIEGVNVLIFNHLWLPSLLLFACGIIVSIYPAVKASRLKPVEAIHHA